MGLKTVSEEFRENLFKINLKTPPDIVIGISDLGGSLSYSAFKDAQGKDGAIHNHTVNDPGNVTEIGHEIRDFLFKRNIQNPSDIDESVIQLTANQSETIRNLGSIGADATLNWRSVVVDVGTLENAAFSTRHANLSRNREHDVTDPSESNQFVAGDGYNFVSLIQTLGEIPRVNDFKVPNLKSVSNRDNPDNEEALKLYLKLNKYVPEEYTSARIRDNILKTIYGKTTYVKDNTNSIENLTPGNYAYRNFYNLNTNATLAEVMSQEKTILQSDTLLMNIGAMMLQYNLQERFAQNLYSETLGRINIVNYNPNGTMPAELDFLELIKTAKDPLNNLIEKNYTITSPRNFIGKTAQFLLGLEGVTSPFNLWESVYIGGKDLTPTTIPNIEKPADTIDTEVYSTKDDEDLLRKTGGGQRWSLYENLNMNKYSPSYEKRAELIGFQKPPKGIYYIGSETSPPINILQAQGVNIESPEKLSRVFDPTDVGGYAENEDMIWTNRYDDDETPTNLTEYIDFVTTKYAERKSYALPFREGSLMDVTQRLLNIGGQNSPIRNLRTIFKDDKTILSKGSAIPQVNVVVPEDGSRYAYEFLDPEKVGYARTWTKGKPYAKISHLIKYGELIRRERNSVLDRNGNYNIFPSKLNVGTLYDQDMLGKDGVRERFADKNFDKVRARKYMFSIENLAWKESDKFELLPAFEKGSNGGRIMWFPPYGIALNETSNADWSTHKLLGRPEPIYTYNNTERSANLQFKVIVDHPSILNLLVQKELKSLTDEQVDDVLSAFFAGAQEYDIFELARIWGVFSNEDISFFKDVIEGKYEYPANITWSKKVAFNYKKRSEEKQILPSTQVTEVKEKINNVKLFFHNEAPVNTTDTYDMVYTQYKDLLYAGSATSLKEGCNLDYVNSIGVNAPIKYFLGEQDIDFEAEYATTLDTLKDLKILLGDLKENQVVDIQINAYTSSLGTDEFNQKLAKRRAYSVANWIKDVLGLKLRNEASNTEKSFNIELIEEKNILRTVVQIKGDYGGGSNFKERTVDEMYIDCKWKSDGYDEIIPILITDRENEEQYPPDKTVFEQGGCENIDFSVLSYPASYARRVELVSTIVDLPETEITDDIEQIQTVNTNPIETDARVDEYSSFINKRDIATRILNKLITENEYFDYLNDTSPMVFKSLKEKLKYFSPSFHSMTPEGLNARLTFLQQCVRPGDTVKIKGVGGKTNIISNLTFGRPPVCVLRIGDFFNTKIIINSINIDYNQVGGSSISYDLNPEGIGVQPMIAHVIMDIKIIGGAGLREPVKELQNALSFNYYANADIYESKSHGQTNLDERYLENLELAYDSTELDIQQLNIQKLENINPDVDTNFTHFGELSTTKIYSTIFSDEPAYNPNHKINDSTGLSIVQYYDMDYSNMFSRMYESYVNYMNNYTSTLSEIAGDTNSSSFTWLMFTGIVDSIDNGQKSDDSISYTIFPDKPAWRTDKNYFSIGYDSYPKNNTYAKSKLHIYPQQENDRVLGVNDYSIGDFAGVILPQYFDRATISNMMTGYALNFKEYLQCEEWLLFTPAVYTKFNLLPAVAQQAFRDEVLLLFNDYFTVSVVEKVNTIENSGGLFADFYQKNMAVNCVCNGLDGGTSEAGLRYLEVVPNINTTDTTLTPDLRIFGKDMSTPLDPLNAFPIPIDLSGDMKTYGVVNAMDDDNERGYFNYLKNQITTPAMKNAGLPVYDFNDNRWEKNDTEITDVEMKTIFEKLNYEFLYFANMTSDIFINDTFSFEAKNLLRYRGEKDISTYSNIRKTRIQNILNISGNYYRPHYLCYLGEDNELKNVIIPKLEDIVIENIFFFDFILDVATETDTTTSKLSQIKTKMLTTIDDDDTANIALVNKFINEIKTQTTQKVIADYKKSIDAFITRYEELLTETKNEMDVVLDKITLQSNNATASGYTVKMFEVDSALANTYGKEAISGYYKWLKEFAENLAIASTIQTLP